MQRNVWAVLGVSLGVGLMSAAGTGCSAVQRIQAEKTVASVLISDEQEEQLGRQVKAELEQKQGIKYVEDTEVVEYVRTLSQPILVAANKERPGVRWRINVIDDPKTVNAFATPGGYLYVYTGLILASEDEAELAGVMAHEAGHVVGRHSARALVGAYGLQAVAQVALGENPGTLAQIATALAGNGVQLAHGRSQETEADEYGARYAAAARYEPQGLVRFFQKLQSQEGQGSAVLKWLSTHPPSSERVAHLEKFIAANSLSGTERGVDRLAAIKRKLRK